MPSISRRLGRRRPVSGTAKMSTGLERIRRRGPVMLERLQVVNLSAARHGCIFGRGCDGICGHNGRPPVYPEEVERLDAFLEKFLPEMRPEARAAAVAGGYLSERQKRGLPMLRVVDGWCIF